MPEYQPDDHKKYAKGQKLPEKDVAMKKKVLIIGAGVSGLASAKIAVNEIVKDDK